tara:strand:+ start:595 stop:891 length:297 start_codon:yes stop_codon:yes gene_type:complete
MTIEYLKKSPKTSSTDDTKTRQIVENILKDIEKTKEDGCKELSKKFDKYEGEVIVSKEKIEEIKKNLDQKTRTIYNFPMTELENLQKHNSKIMVKILK